MPEQQEEVTVRLEKLPVACRGEFLLSLFRQSQQKSSFLPEATNPYDILNSYRPHP